jgi:hypothetical protein
MMNPHNEGHLRAAARACAWLALLGIASMSACGSSSKATGAEGGACFSNGTCNAGLSCLSRLCVNASPSDAAASEGGGAGGAAAGAAGAVAGSAGAGGTPSSTAGANGAAGATANAGAGGATAGSGGATAGSGGATVGAAGDHGDASVGDAGADAGLALPTVAPSHLQVWLTADRGLRCTSDEVTAWLDQSGRGRDATRGTHKGPQCPQTLHALHGVNLPYFSSPGSSPPFNDETLDLDLAFLANTDYTIFVVERRWADRTAASGGNEELIGTDAPAGASGCPSSGFQISLGYGFYDGYPALGYESLCYQPFTGTRGQAPATPAQPPAPATYDMLRLQQSAAASPTVWQNGSKINGGAASGGPATEFAGGSIGRAFSTASENRFQGDIAEVVAFDTALSDDEAQQMGAYFKQHWGLQ